MSTTRAVRLRRVSAGESASAAGALGSSAPVGLGRSPQWQERTSTTALRRAATTPRAGSRRFPVGAAIQSDSSKDRAETR